MTQPDFEALWRKAVDAYGVAYDAAPGPLGARSRIRAGDQAASQVLREAFEAQLAEVRAARDVTWQEGYRAGENKWADVVAEHLATIARLREANRCLRNGYADAASGLTYVRQHHGNLSGVGFQRVEDHFFEWVTMPEREGLLAGSHVLPAPHARTELNGESDHG